MTVTSQINYVAVAQTAVVADTPIAWGANLDAASDIQVWYNGDQMAVLNTHYTVQLATDFMTATVTPLAALVTLLDATNKLILRRTPTYLQPINTAAIQGLPEERLEKFMDRTAQQLMRAQDNADRSILQHAGKEPHSLVFTLPLALADALGKWLRFSSSDEGVIEAVEGLGWQQLSADPSNDSALGQDNDLGAVTAGINLGQVYKKISGVWVDQGWSIRGPQGIQGLSGDGSGDVVGPVTHADQALFAASGPNSRVMAATNVLVDGSDNVTGVNDLTTINDLIVGNLLKAGAIIVRSATAGSLMVSGGVAGTDGANLLVYAADHASRAGDFALRDGTTEVISYDKSADLLDINKGLILSERVLLTERATPATPASGFGDLFVDTNGKPKFINDAGVVHDLSNEGKHAYYVDAMGLRPASTNGAEYGFEETTTNKVMMDFYRFDDTTDEYVQFKFKLPKSYNDGTISAKFSWAADTATSGNVIWAIQAVCIGNDDPIDSSWGTAVTITDTALSAAKDQGETAETGAVTIANAAAEEMCYVRIYRNASAGGDTMSGDALLLGVEVFLTTDAGTDD